MNFGKIISLAIPLMIILFLLFILGIFILPTNGFVSAMLSFLPANISGGVIILLLIPFVIFLFLLYKAFNLFREVLSAI